MSVELNVKGDTPQELMRLFHALFLAGQDLGDGTPMETPPAEGERNRPQAEKTGSQVVNITLNNPGAVEQTSPEDISNTEVRTSLAEQIQSISKMVRTSNGEKEELRAVSERRKATIEEMAEGADRFLSGLRVEMHDKKDRDLLLALLERTEKDGVERCLTYEDIGERMGGVTKQAVGARVRRLKEQYPGPWDYVDAVRNPKQVRDFSELSPSNRAELGIDASYNHDMN